MSAPPRRVSRPAAAARIVAVLTVGAFWPPLAAARDLPKQEHVALDLRTPLGRLADLSLYGPGAEKMARTDDDGRRVAVPAWRGRVDVLGVEWPGRLRGGSDVAVRYELIAVGPPLPRYGAGVTLRLCYDAPNTLSTVLQRSK